MKFVVSTFILISVWLSSLMPLHADPLEEAYNRGYDAGRSDCPASTLFSNRNDPGAVAVTVFSMDNGREQLEFLDSSGPLMTREIPKGSSIAIIPPNLKDDVLKLDADAFVEEGKYILPSIGR